MLIYDVTYRRHGRQLPDMDRAVSERYLASLPADLAIGETAYARCLNNPHEDREIDRRGVRRVAP